MKIQRYRIFDETVDFVDCPEVAVGFRSILRGWSIDELPHDSRHPAYITFRRGKNRFSWNAPWLEGRERRLQDPSRTLFDAICDFHYEFIDWYVARNPEYFCLHMAAAIFPCGAVLFPCEQKAGKSILTVQLAQRGHRILGDDVVAMTPEAGHATALGLLPRLRLPLPEKVLTLDLIDFIQNRSVLSDKYYQYVDLAEGEISSFGEKAPICGVVLLERRKKAKAGLTRLSVSSALKALIDRNFGRLRDPDGIFDRLRQIASDNPCYTLRYSRPEEAALVLEERFGRLH